MQALASGRLAAVIRNDVCVHMYREIDFIVLLQSAINPEERVTKSHGTMTCSSRAGVSIILCPCSGLSKAGG